MDQESKDANSLLVELDRGLQSPSIGEQTEAVVRFTSLFQRYPLPVLVDSACLKLSEAFKLGSNFIRVQICEVLERNQSQLNKIYNIDVFFRNIFTVTTSNDPIARSITLLTLGNIAPIVSAYKNIHHCISSSLESNIECELNASIACAACFVKQSAEFACNIYPKMVSIIDSSKTSVDIKLRALFVLDHGFYNAIDAMTVRSFLIGVIEKSNHRRLICTCLTLSTKIAFTSLSHIRPQIELLIKLAMNDTRPPIRMNALKNLRFLAARSPHIWESAHVEPLVERLESKIANKDSINHDPYSCLYLSIFCKLLSCKCNFISQETKTRIFQQCYKLALNQNNPALCTMAFELLTLVLEEQSFSTADNMLEYKPSNLETDTFDAIKKFVINSSPSSKSTRSRGDSNSQQKQKPAAQPKAIYRHIVRLCKLNPHYCSELLKLLFTRISSKDCSISEISPHLTELMCAVSESNNDLVLSPDDYWKLIKTKSADLSETHLLNICVLYFQALRLRPMHSASESLVDKVTQNHSLWFGFKTMRQAMRYGHYGIAGLICNELHEHVTTDTTDFYFKSLRRICTAESLLVQGFDQDANLKAAIPIYEGAMSPLRASLGHSRTTNFQLGFLRLRISSLHAHSTLRQCCKIYQASPVTYATLLNSIGQTRINGDNSFPSLGIVQQIPKVARDFRHVAECYEGLSFVSFDCDTRTLDHLQLLKCSCIIMADAIDAIFQYGKNLPVITQLAFKTISEETSLEHRELEEKCNSCLELIREKILRPGITSSNESIEPLIQVLKSLSDEILKCPFAFPRYFFQPLQVTQIKLAITPQPSSSSGNLVLLLNYNFVLKVEGLIQNLSKTQRVIRKVSQVLLTATMSPAKTSEQCSFLVQSTATPDNNYFKTEFLLPLKQAGQFNVDIEVSIIDEQERLWKTGPTERLSLSVS